MQRSLSGMFFALSAVALSIAAGGYWLQHTAFTPSATRDTSAAILSDPDIRREINSIVSTATSPELGVGPNELGRFVEDQVLSTRAGAEMMAQTMYEAHGKILGLRDPLVRLTGSEMIQIVRDDHAADAQTVTLPIDSIGVLVLTRVALRWLVLITGAIGALALIAGLLGRPTRRDLARGVGELLLGLAAGLLVLGWLYPVVAIPAIDSQTWARAIPALARQHQLALVGVVLGAALVGAFLLLSGTGTPKRQSSTPLASSRYQSGGAGWN